MTVPRFNLLLPTLSAALIACSRSKPMPLPRGGDRVPLSMREVSDGLWELTFRDGSDESRLRVRPQLVALPDSLPVAAAVWTLYRVPGYSPRLLLKALAHAHNALDTVVVRPAVDSMRLDVALLAVDAARNSNGAFGRPGTGTWIAAKLFFPDDEGEVYLSISPKTGQAEFGVKDEEYGPVVLRELNRLRSGPSRKSPKER